MRRTFSVRIAENSPEYLILRALTVKFGTFRQAVRFLVREHLELEAARRGAGGERSQ